MLCCCLLHANTNDGHSSADSLWCWGTAYPLWVGSCGNGALWPASAFVGNRRGVFACSELNCNNAPFSSKKKGMMIIPLHSSGTEYTVCSCYLLCPKLQSREAWLASLLHLMPQKRVSLCAQTQGKQTTDNNDVDFLGISRYEPYFYLGLTMRRENVELDVHGCRNGCLQVNSTLLLYVLVFLGHSSHSAQRQQQQRLAPADRLGMQHRCIARSSAIYIFSHALAIYGRGIVYICCYSAELRD